MIRGFTFTVKAQAACRRNLILAAKRNAAKLEAMPRWHCAECGAEKPATVHQKRQTYCSRPCMAAAYRDRLQGENNPHWTDAARKTCEQCGQEFRSYQPIRPYCSRACYKKSDYFMARTRAKKDHNHAEIVAAFRQMGCSVEDLSCQGKGCPDIAVFIAGCVVLVEIKNPNTWYGQKGLSKRQREWAAAWKGAKPEIVRSVEDAVALVQRGGKPRAESAP